MIVVKKIAAKNLTTFLLAIYVFQNGLRCFFVSKLRCYMAHVYQIAYKYRHKTSQTFSTD